MKNVKQANINVNFKGLFKHWLDITKSFHKLTNQEQSILSLLLYYYYEYKKEITNETILWKMVFDYDTKAKIKEELGMKDQVLQNNLTKLRKKNIVQDNQIVKTYIPQLSEDVKNFKVIFNFNII